MPRIRAKEYIEQVVQEELSQDHLAFKVAAQIKLEYEPAVRYRVKKALERLKFRNLGSFIGAEKQKILRRAANCYMTWTSASMHAHDMRAIRASGVPNSNVIFVVESKMQWLQTMRLIFDTHWLDQKQHPLMKDFCDIARKVALDKDAFDQMVEAAKLIVTDQVSRNPLSKEYRKKTTELLNLIPDAPSFINLYLERYKLNNPEFLSIWAEAQKHNFLKECNLHLVGIPLIHEAHVKRILEALDYLQARFEIEQEITANWIEEGFEAPPPAPINLDGLLDLKKAKTEPFHGPLHLGDSTMHIR